MNKKKTFIILAVVVGLLIFASVLYGKIYGMKWDLIMYKSIPHMNLGNTLEKHNLSGSTLFTGNITGFVKFDNEGSQPKDARQYYVIEPLVDFDENSKQIFSIDDIFVLPLLPPTSIGKTKAKIIDESAGAIALEDDNGDKFFIYQSPRGVELGDVGVDSAKLITNNSEYENFMRGFLKKQ